VNKLAIITRILPIICILLRLEFLKHLPRIKLAGAYGRKNMRAARLILCKTYSSGQPKFSDRFMRIELRFAIKIPAFTWLNEIIAPKVYRSDLF